MDERFSRTALLIGAEGMERLKNSHIAIFGIGGVGGYAAEALARCGVGEFTLVDKDVIDVTNINRQIIATTKTVGRPKVEVMRERIADINPEAKVNAHQCFFLPENADKFDFTSYTYVIDAVDNVTAKIEIIMRSKAAGTGIISAMGAGNKIEASMFEAADIYKTQMCPLARVMRRELRKRGVEDLKVIYSKEKAAEVEKIRDGAKITPASISFVPSSAGLLTACETVKDILKI